MVVVQWAAVVCCVVGLPLLGCAESPPPAPETAGVVLPEWAEPPPGSTVGSKQVRRIEQKEGVLYGDGTPQKAGSARRKKEPPPSMFSRRSNSRIYGGCGALNGEKCP